ncbi:MAG: hypothetical protein ACXWWC_03310, partial [Chitinophagaceae bacterium]
LLRSDDELLVPLADEINFARSYLHLAKERFGTAIEASINLDENTLKKFIPPLSLQVILENIIYTNALDKKKPLFIHISADNEHELCIVNSIQEKIIRKNLAIDDGLDNLVNKYKMLNSPPVVIRDADNKRKMLLPIFFHNEAVI